MRRRDILRGAGAVALGGCVTAPPLPAAGQTVWSFDRLDRIGGFPASVEGAPAIIEGPRGRALQFNGSTDAVFIAGHPLAGASAFTFEALFRPDGGAEEQRWFHLQEDPALPDAPSGGTRMLFEIRVYGRQWTLDAFVKGPGYNHTLLFPDKLHPVGRWHHVAQTCDGRMYRSYVDGVLQGEAEIAFAPQGPGRSSVGCRLNRVDYFNGAVAEARFSRTALPPSRFSLL
ncbi:LamG domain-containing protein [Brevundimonas sp.]|uniref:LamG domain-containing protein n=1 Tax=Brevundimonas sp. TaxID=1871086 RepID=UPI002D559061|nr:LamG domain-containing protein [Brevundimonas sp.]HYC98726.1 LamG domain-containing protein [Brevundimonas sp.]